MMLDEKQAVKTVPAQSVAVSLTSAPVPVSASGVVSVPWFRHPTILAAVIGASGLLIAAAFSRRRF